MLNLDTHVLLYALAGKLKPRERELLAGDTWSVSAIVLWEICKLAELKRVKIDLDDADVERTLRRIHTWPLTLEICRRSCNLDVAGDPAERQLPERAEDEPERRAGERRRQGEAGDRDAPDRTAAPLAERGDAREHRLASGRPRRPDRREHGDRDADPDAAPAHRVSSVIPASRSG